MNKKRVIIGIVFVVILALLAGGYFAFGKVNDFLSENKKKEEEFLAMKTQFENQIEEQKNKIEELEEFKKEQEKVDLFEIEEKEGESNESSGLSEQQVNNMIYCDRYKETYTAERYQKMLDRPDDVKKDCVKFTKKSHEVCEEMNESARKEENCDKKYDVDKCDKNKKDEQKIVDEWVVKYNEYNKKCK